MSRLRAVLRRRRGTAASATSRIALVAAALCVSAVGCGDDDGDVRFDLGAPQDMQRLLDAQPSDFGASDMAPPRMDMSAPMCPGICRPDRPSGCDGTATCVLERAEPRCANSVGAEPAGSICETTDQCAAGYACFQRRTGGVCGRICCRGDDSACPGEVCRGTGVLVDGVETGYGECQAPRECDVLAAPVDVCEPGEGCYVIAEDETGCLRAGEGESGEMCEAPNDCAPGFACVGAFDGRCARICRLGRMEDCEDGEGSCVAYAQSPEGTGLCTPDTSAP